jgi:hypothetical protein
MRLPARLVAWLVGLSSILAMQVAHSLAATPVSPPTGTIFREGENVVAHWTLDASSGEEAEYIDWAPSPGLDPGGEFSSQEYDYDDLEPQQTSYVFSRPSPGRYYWHIDSTVFHGPTALFGVLDLISVSEAKRYTKRVIHRGKRAYLHISGLRCRVKTDFKAKCKFLAWIGDVSYKGKGALFYSKNDFDDNVDDFHWDYRVRYTNHYCLAVQNKSRGRCIDKQRWRG